MFQDSFLASVALNSEKIAIYSCKTSAFPITTLDCSVSDNTKCFICTYTLPE